MGNKKFKYCINTSKALLAFVVVVFTANQCVAQFTVKAKIDSTSYLIGDYIKAQIYTTYDSSFQLQLPLLSGTLQLDSIKSIDFLGAATKDSIINGKIIKHHLQYIFTAFDSGKYFIPPIAFAFQNKKTKTIDSLKTDSLFFTVSIVEADTSKSIKPIKEPLNTPFIIAEYKDYIVYGLLAWLIIAILLYVYFTYFKKKKKVIVEAPVIKRPSHEIALEKLIQLKNEKLWQKGEVKKYYSSLSDIMREYLENRFHIVALEATTEEIIEKMKIFAIAREQKIVLQEMLELSDLVKFAKTNPLPDEHERSMFIAEQFIDQTKYDAAN